MRHFNKFIILLLLVSYMSLGAQTYVSPKQKTTSNGFTNRVKTELFKIVIIDGNSFSAELPDGGSISGTIEHWKTIDRSPEEIRTLYSIEGGGLLSVKDDLVDNNWDCIILNLLSTPSKKIYTFWLTDGNKGDD